MSNAAQNIDGSWASGISPYPTDTKCINMQNANDTSDPSCWNSSYNSTYNWSVTTVAPSVPSGSTYSFIQ